MATPTLQLPPEPRDPQESREPIRVQGIKVLPSPNPGAANEPAAAELKFGTVPAKDPLKLEALVQQLKANSFSARQDASAQLKELIREAAPRLLLESRRNRAAEPEASAELIARSRSLILHAPADFSGRGTLSDVLAALSAKTGVPINIIFEDPHNRVTPQVEFSRSNTTLAALVSDLARVCNFEAEVSGQRITLRQNTPEEIGLQQLMIWAGMAPPARLMRPGMPAPFQMPMPNPKREEPGD